MYYSTYRSWFVAVIILAARSSLERGSIQLLWRRR